MEVFSNVDGQNKNLALALGFFDGVHLGHQEVIKSAVDYAKLTGQKSAVITFKEHPQVVLRGVKPEYISTVNFKRKMLEDLGVDFCYELDFNSVVHLSAQKYLKDFLIRNFAPVSISTGFNHNFGASKSGSSFILEDCATKYGYKYFKIPPVMIDEEIVSSSLIRKKLAQAEIVVANRMLGKNFSVEGVVQKGAKLASKIGFKTANIFYPENTISLPFGVYSVNVYYRGICFSAIANYGIKPTFDSLTEKPILEVHILDFDKDIYGENLKIEFLDFIRYEKKFSNVEDLICQINLDINQRRC